VKVQHPQGSQASTPKRPIVGSPVQADASDTPEHTSTNRQGQQGPPVISRRLTGITEAFSHSISPLAQVYAPIQVDDGISDNAWVSKSPTYAYPTSGVSYGRTTRRRNASTAPGRMSSDHAPHFPHSEEGLGIGDFMSGPASRGSEGRSWDEDKLKSVTHIESEEEQLRGELKLERRLVGMEERQKRIEDMLIQLIGR
jgi:hypothetical protein